MTIDELKALLDEGKISKEQFEALARAIDPNYTDEPEPSPTPDPAPAPDLEKLIQSAVDRATNKLGNDNKKLRQQLDDLKKNHLTQEQAAEIERKQREDDLAEREKSLRDEKNRWYAMKAIKAAGLDDGSDRALELVDFVMGGTEDDISAKVKAFGGLVQRLVKAEVDKTFKQHGRNPEQGSGGGNNNPWSKENWNITAQMVMEQTNPELAKQLMAAAGLK